MGASSLDGCLVNHNSTTAKTLDGSQVLEVLGRQTPKQSTWQKGQMLQRRLQATQDHIQGAHSEEDLEDHCSVRPVNTSQ